MVLLLLSLASSCRGGAFGAASRADTVEAYRAFLRANPDDSDAETARERLAELELAEARKVHSVVAYKRFLDEFSESGQGPAARALLETLRFNAAVERRTSVALRQFLKEHPDGPHRAEAEALLGQLELGELGTVDDQATLAALIARHPDAVAAEEAGARLDELAWAKAKTAAALLGYLKEFPAGAHRDEARAGLTSAEIDGLLVSGDEAQARAVAQKSPLKALVPELDARFERSRAISRLLALKDERVRRALPSYTLRPLEELARALQSPDSMDRWQAAEELGFHVSVMALGPLLEAFRTARLSIVRERSSESLSRIFQALPPRVAEYQLATRLEELGRGASDPQLVMTAALLLDLSGQRDRASAEYQRVWDASAPDPLVLRRWATVRLERRQFFSAAVAARQLALHAATTSAQVPSPAETNALASAREQCSAAEEARFAVGVLERAAKEPTDFPEDVGAFLTRAREELRLVEAHLRDAELALLAVDGSARSCGDASVAERMAAGEAMRLAALVSLRARPLPELPLLLEIVRERDPSPRVREAASPHSSRR